MIDGRVESTGLFKGWTDGFFNDRPDPARIASALVLGESAGNRSRPKGP